MTALIFTFLSPREAAQQKKKKRKIILESNERVSEIKWRGRERERVKNKENLLIFLYFFSALYVCTTYSQKFFMRASSWSQAHTNLLLCRLFFIPLSLSLAIKLVRLFFFEFATNFPQLVCGTQNKYFSRQQLFTLENYLKKSSKLI